MVKKFDQIFSVIKFHIRKIDEDKLASKSPVVNFNADYDKIKFLTDDSLPLDKLIYYSNY